MFGRMNAPGDAENRLPRGDFVRINKAVSMVSETRAKLRPRKGGQEHTPRASVEIEHQVGACHGVASLIHSCNARENLRESRLDNHADF